MSDFVIKFGVPADTRRIADMLRDRPGMADATIHTYTFSWGAAVVQEPRGRGYVPLHEHAELFCCVGRPRFVGVTHEDRGHDGFNRIFAERWRRGDRKDLSDALTGMFVIVRCHDAGLDVMTDQMGFHPVYVGNASTGTLAAVGTHVEALAAIVGRQTAFDLVSLGELLVYNYVTFPFTSREGIRELDPASLNTFSRAEEGWRHGRTTYWEPTEPEVFPTRPESVEEIEQAIRFGADDITRGSDRVAVTLSGGQDSRVLLAALPREKRAGAITYVTRENREVEVARRVAQACGVPQLLARRPSEFHAELLLDRGPRLLGIERRAAAHGFCVIDNDLHRSFDLILGGQLSDTFLKDHFMPKPMKEQLRPKGLPERAKRLAKRVLGFESVARDNGNPLSTVGRHVLEAHLKKDIREAVRARREQRLREVESVRPSTAEEWLRFWPTSRQDDLGHILGNSKLFAFDSLYMHRGIVEAGARLSPVSRYAGRAAHEAFRRVYGRLGRIENANTLLPADADERAERRAWKRRRARRAIDHERLSPSATPWNDVPGSWVDMKLLQTLSPRWQEYRRALADSPALDVLDGVVAQDAADLVAQYDEAAAPTFNAMFMQLACVIDSLLRPEPALAVQEAAS